MNGPYQYRFRYNSGRTGAVFRGLAHSSLNHETNPFLLPLHPFPGHAGRLFVTLFSWDCMNSLGELFPDYRYFHSWLRESESRILLFTASDCVFLSDSSSPSEETAFPEASMDLYHGDIPSVDDSVLFLESGYQPVFLVLKP